MHNNRASRERKSSADSSMKRLIFFIHRLCKSALVLGRSINTASGPSNPASPEKNGTLPRSATLSGQSRSHASMGDSA